MPFQPGKESINQRSIHDAYSNSGGAVQIHSSDGGTCQPVSYSASLVSVNDAATWCIKGQALNMVPIKNRKWKELMAQRKEIRRQEMTEGMARHKVLKEGQKKV
ncbi:hypothetical protein XENORESO_020828 [Xenotaenia resolanae]|uniref:Uncharacterized protein n=1 Tax=Xenotaenia resolanae TaxID=208358 RepID=A0ABV0X4J8_9TELE